MNISSSIDPADYPACDIETWTLRPGLVVQRRLPVNFHPNDSALFSHELESEIPRTYLLEIKDVRASPEGVLFKHGKILPVSFAFPWMWEEWRRDKVLRFLARNQVFRKHSKFDQDAVWITDNWSQGYFHWLADALPRLFVVRDRLSDFALLLPHRFKEMEFVRASLKPFNPGGIEFMREDEALLCRRLFVPTHTAPSGQHNEEIIKGVRDLLVNYHNENKGREADGRVYISRGRAARRTIINEAEVLDVLGEFGFRILYPEDLSFADQVKIFSAARWLVSNHGAGLTNMLFMLPGSNVLELRHQTDKVSNCYFTLASALSLNYFYQICAPRQPDEAPHTADLLVDCRALRKNIRLMLGS